MTMANWRRLLKWLGWLVGGAVVLLVAAYLTLLAFNWRDRPPSEGAIRLAAMYRNRPAVPDGDNGYVYAMGFAVDSNGNPRAAGLRRIEWLQEIPDAAQYPLSGDPAPDNQGYMSARSPAAQRLAEACRFASRECVDALEGVDEVMREWLQAEEWLLERYLALLRHEGWLETVPFDGRAPLPSYGMVSDGQKLLLVKAAILASQKDVAAVRSLLASDMRFWRHVLESSDILITKMVAVAALKRTFGVGNLVLRRLPPELAMDAMPQEWATEITDAERSLLRCLVGEWVSAGRLANRTATSGSWLPVSGANSVSAVSRLLSSMMMPLFQPQDMSNRQAEMLIQAVDALNVPLDQFPAALERAGTIFQGSEEGTLPFLYNPIGDVLLWMSSPAYLPYGARVADLEGIRRAAVLTTELRNRKVPAARVRVELEASGVRVPYTGEPYEWDKEEGVIVFRGLEPKERGRHTFKY